MTATIWFDSLVSVGIVSLLSLLGVTLLSLEAAVLKRLIMVLVSLAVGALFGDAFIHLLPEAYHHFSNDMTVGFLTLGGFMAFFLIEKYLHWHYYSEDKDNSIHHHIHPVGYINLTADSLHNFVDGVVIGTSYLISVPLGIATTIAVILHEIPHEVGNFGVLINAGFTRRRALLLNFLTALTAILGTILALVFGQKIAAINDIALPITAGGFIYIAGVDLLPDLHKDNQPIHSIIQFLGILLGLAVMVWVKIHFG